jgi:hypothetical protein
MYRLSAWFLVPAAGNLAGGYWYITIANEPAARLERRYSPGKGNGRRVECV